jgi:hypothetical protein
MIKQVCLIITLTNHYTEDYHKLGIGGITSLITDVRFSHWGSVVCLECVYDPHGTKLPYRIIFRGCCQVEWNVWDSLNLLDAEADLIGIHLGVADYQEPALIHTDDIFELF